MTPPRPVEEVARAMAFACDGEDTSDAPVFRSMSLAAIRELRDLDMLNERAFDLLKHEGQYEATRPSRYVFPAEEGK